MRCIINLQKAHRMSEITSKIIVDDSFPAVVDLLNSDEVESLCASVEQEIEALKQDYFSDLTDERFGSDYIFHESVVMKALAYRWATAERFQFLANKAANVLSGHRNVSQTDPNDFYVHPIFYLRKSKANYVRDERTRSVFLDGQPHYDRSFGVFAFTFWLSLRDASKNTGGLAFFKDDPKLNEKFMTAWGQKNKYSYDKYIDAHEKLDQILIDKVIDPNIKAGQAYLFHSNVLHGSTKALTEARLSFDFRLIHRDDLKNASSADQSLILKFNEDIDLSQSYGLVALGDTAASSQHLRRDDLEGDIVKKLNQIENFRLPKQMLHWQVEYEWFR
jgi:hypothetical protein